MKGININCSTQPFVQQILAGIKTIETRDRPVLDCYIGKRIGLIETGRGSAKLKGYATITGRKKYENVYEFADDYEKHRVAEASLYYFKDLKYGYVLADVVAIKPKRVKTLGIISREIEEEM